MTEQQAVEIEPVADKAIKIENDAEIHEIRYSDGSRTYEVCLIDRNYKWRVFVCKSRIKAKQLLSGYLMSR